jgi:ABC-type transport system involved in multi-copper enzyme maturation permease subunit
MKYFSKGIFYKELKLARWFLFILTGELLYLFNLTFINNINLLKEAAKNGNLHYENYSYSFNLIFNYTDSSHLLFMISIIMFASIMVGNDYANKKYEFLASLPYKREEIIITKYAAAVIITVISFTISFIAVLLTFKNNQPLLSYYLSWSFLYKYYFANLLVYIFIITFTMLIQTLCGKNILGGILSGIFLILPLGLSILFEEVFRMIFFVKMRVGDYDYLTNIYNKLGDAAYKLTPIAYATDYDKYMKYGYRIIILLILILVLIKLLIKSFKNLPFERCGYISIYKSGDRILKIGISFCSALLAADILAANLTNTFKLYSIDKNLVQQYVSYTIISFIVCFIIVGLLVYYITSKVINLSKS